MDTDNNNQTEQSAAGPSPVTGSPVKFGDVAPTEPEPKRNSVKLILTVAAVIVLLLIGIFSIKRFIDTSSFKTAYAAESARCGGQPLIRVYEKLWFGQVRNEILVPNHPSYDLTVRANSNLFSYSPTDGEILDMYCDLEEAGVDPYTGETRNGGFNVNTLPEEEVRKLAKRRIDDYEASNSLTLMQPNYVPEYITESKLDVFGGSTSGLLLPYVIEYKNSEGKRAIYSCGHSQKSESFTSVVGYKREKINAQDNLVPESLVRTYLEYRADIALFTYNNRRVWSIQAEWWPKVGNTKALLRCELVDDDNLLTQEDGNRMITDFLELDVNAFENTSYGN